MKRLLVCGLVACSAPPRPAPIGNVAGTDPTREKLCAGDKLTGVVIISDRNNEPAVTAIIGTFPAENLGERVAATDAHGKFVLEGLEPGHDRLRLFYENRSYSATMPKKCDPVTIEIDLTDDLDNWKVMRIK